MTVSTSTPGKLILLGEYAVLEGAPAVVTAVNKFAKITINESETNQYYFNAPNLDLKELKYQINKKQSLIFEKILDETKTKQLNLFTKIFLFIYKHIKKQNKSLIPCHIKIDTSDFYFKNTTQKLGLGSSAALTVGLIKSLYNFNNIKFENSNELFHLALQTHFEAQEKIGSGIDVAASAFSGTGVFKKTEKKYSFEPITLPANLFMIPIWTGSSTSTPQFVSKTNQLKTKNLDVYNRIIKALSDLSIQGCDYLINNDSINFLDVINKYYESLDELGTNSGIQIISETHEKIRKIIKKCNGFYKPSGAGGSDIGIAFTNDLKVKEKIIEKINESNFKYIKLETINDK